MDMSMNTVEHSEITFFN